ncbi:pilus assembly protein N-terminal domain-containing protein [Pseudovibrio sp. Tun.PSC04-5.I4]|uniref:pilus assembly protein N-terminal domain-containing protein n=1 Tax=Pseudovibrio sp. Tun.PSC04-5.I4 TaxID=1798213 RepID=UPI000885CBCF|nr:pilus assembly protein N-terminal domain-containing protein [Pseudovibrio sp. Tun.PSC04-5.I4]SDR17696.1 Pilus formation protein N terminal region [Pseudovibrio sp. Tun.PSC04-5.I4]
MLKKLHNQVVARPIAFWSQMFCAAVMTAGLVGATTSAQADVEVITDQAKVFRLDEPAETIILGNPSIADVTIHDRVTIVITGKSYGTTNLIVLNADSEPVVEEQITVTAATAGYVAVQRNSSRFTYSCNPDCHEVLRLGDDKKKITDIAGTISARNELAENGIVANSGQ